MEPVVEPRGPSTSAPDACVASDEGRTGGNASRAPHAARRTVSRVSRGGRTPRPRTAAIAVALALLSRGVYAIAHDGGGGKPSAGSAASVGGDDDGKQQLLRIYVHPVPDKFCKGAYDGWPKRGTKETVVLYFNNIYEYMSPDMHPFGWPVNPGDETLRMTNQFSVERWFQVCNGGRW